MSTYNSAQEILHSIGYPENKINEMTIYSFLVICGINEGHSWATAKQESLGISKGVMKLIKENYGKHYAPNTRETFRKLVLDEFVIAGIVVKNPDFPKLPTNSPRTHYKLSDATFNLIKTYGSESWEKNLLVYQNKVKSLVEIYNKKREILQIPVTLTNGKIVNLSPGAHNELQAAIVQEFASRFAKGSMLLYLGDTSQKDLYTDKDFLEYLDIPIDGNSKLPDVILFDQEKMWLFLIEAVTSVGPMSPKRIVELNKLLSNCPADFIFVTAFPDMQMFKKFSSQLAWETEVWIMDMPDHMIHFNGDRFMGPRK